VSLYEVLVTNRLAILFFAVWGGKNQKKVRNYDFVVIYKRSLFGFFPFS
jgi:hypothetical protein